MDRSSPSSSAKPSTSHKHSVESSQQNGNNAKIEERIDNSKEILATSLHPLCDIEQILHQILSHLNPKDLKSASLVCSAWLPVVQKIMVKNKRLSLSSVQCQNFLLERPHDHVGGLHRSIETTTSISLKLDLNHYPFNQTQLGEDQSELATTYKNRVGKISWALAEKLLIFLKEKNVAVVDLKLRVCPCDLERMWTLLLYLSSELRRVDIVIRCVSGNFHFDHQFEKFRSLQDGTLGSLPLASAIEQNEHPTRFTNLQQLSYVSQVNGELASLTKSVVLQVGGKIMTHGSSLQTLTFNKSFDELLELLNAMESYQRIKSTIWNNLHRLNVCTISSIGFRTLSAASANLKLKTLSFKLEDGARVQSMYEFLSHQTTLEQLTIDFDTFPHIPDYIPFATNLANLTELTMKKYYGSLNFVPALPNLESLTLIDVKLSIAFHDDVYAELRQSNLKTLKIDRAERGGIYAYYSDFYTKFVTLFHKLEKLYIENLSDDELQIIIAGLPNLKELNIADGFFTDAGISENGSAEGQSGNVEDLGNRMIHTALPLSHLKHLTKLAMQSDSITDDGVRNGLIGCTKLKSLSLVTCPLIEETSLQLCRFIPCLEELRIITVRQFLPEAIAEANEKWGKDRKLIIKNYTDLF